MFWGIELEPSKPYNLTPKYPLHITKCILGNSENEDEKARNIIKCQSGEDKESSYVIASLRFGVKEQTSLDLVFEPEVPIIFSTSGPSKVSLVGFYITSFDHDEDDEEEEEEEEDEDEASEAAREQGADLKALIGDEELDDDEEDFDPNENEEANKEQHMRDIIDDKIFKTELKAEKRQLKKKKEEEEAEEEEEKPSKKAQKTEKGKKAVAKEKTPEPAKKQQQQQQQQPKVGEIKKYPNGLIVQDIVLGTGAKPLRGHKAVMNYVGRLKNGKIFDKSDRPFTFKFGVGQVIKGWDIGIGSMQVGGKRKLTIPPSLGYGNQRVGPIPANSTLIFDVELIAVK